MLHSHRRVLWLLNHRTLMPFELPLLHDLGFEVFAPKVMPRGLRSSIVDFGYDETLTLPRAALQRLNAFNFYEDEWPDDIVLLVNQYFGSVFTIPYARQFEQALLKFHGRLFFRAFGLENSRNYRGMLIDLYGPDVLARIDAAGDRFWFAQGYEQLAECEPPLLAERSIYLPLGLPSAFWETACNDYAGTYRRILFVCPNCVTDPYYAGVYKCFKEQLGDFPHVIVGAQDVPVNDPHLLGFVPDETMSRLFRECAVCYYHSHELRHVHYTPVEAVIHGMPVVYYADSLLGRLTPGVKLGRCESESQARATIQRILDGDKEFVADLRQDQVAMLAPFSSGYCRAEWEHSLRDAGLLPGQWSEPNAWINVKEGWGGWRPPWRHPWLKLPATPRTPGYSRLGLEHSSYEAALAAGIDFSLDALPAIAHRVLGLSYPESIGRWSDGDHVRISFVDPLPPSFRLRVTACAYRDNVHVPVTVALGEIRREVQFGEAPSTASIYFHGDGRCRHLDWYIPAPIRPDGDSRFIGIALARLSIDIPDASRGLSEIVDFSKVEFPWFIERIHGFSFAEGHGRWSDGSRAGVVFALAPKGAFRVRIVAKAYGDNIGAAITVILGREHRTVYFSEDVQECAIDWGNQDGSRDLVFEIPYPVQPPGDNRRVGLMISSLAIELLDVERD